MFFQNCGNVVLNKNDSGSTAEIFSPAPAAPAPLPAHAPAAAVIATPAPCVPHLNNNGIYGNFQVQCLASPETSIINDINQAISSNDISKQLKN